MGLPKIRNKMYICLQQSQEMNQLREEARRDEKKLISEGRTGELSALRQEAERRRGLLEYEHRLEVIELGQREFEQAKRQLYEARFNLVAPLQRFRGF
jgi:hypothetical protein